MREEDFNISVLQLEKLCILAKHREIRFRGFVLSVMGLLAPMMEEEGLSNEPTDRAMSASQVEARRQPENPYTISAEDGSSNFYCSGCGRTLESSYAICWQCFGSGTTNRAAGESTRGGAIEQVRPESVSFAKAPCPQCQEPICYAVEKRAQADGRTSARLNCQSCIEGLVLIIKDSREAIVAIIPASNVLEAYGSGGDCEKVTCESCGDIWIMPASMDYILCDKLHLRKDEATGKVSTIRCDTVIRRVKEETKK